MPQLICCPLNAITGAASWAAKVCVTTKSFTALAGMEKVNWKVSLLVIFAPTVTGPYYGGRRANAAAQSSTGQPHVCVPASVAVPVSVTVTVTAVPKV